MQGIILFLLFFSLNFLFFALNPSLQAADSATNPIVIQNPDNSTWLLDNILLKSEKIKDNYERCELLIKIAGAYIESNKYDAAENILRRAAEIAQKKENKIESCVLFSKIIEKLLIIGKADDALNLLRYITLTDSRNHLMIKIILNYISKDRFDKAMMLVKEIRDPAFKAITLNEIAVILSEKKSYDQFVKAQKELGADSFTQSLVRTIAREKAKNKKENSATDIFTSSSRSGKVKALIYLAEEQIAAGKPSQQSVTILEEAVLGLEKIKNRFVKDDCLAKIGAAYVKIGQLDKSRTIANSIQIPFSRSELLTEIASAYIGKNELQKASALMQDISVQYFKEKIAARMIIRYTEQGEENQAETACRLLNNIQSRARAYYLVTEYFAKKAEFTQAFEICEKIDDPKIRMNALLLVAGQLREKQENSPQIRQQALKSLL